MLDANQKQAVESLDRSLVVTAGAGSGKTRVLVERYIELITKQTDGQMSGPDSVVAITFTEKAAAQMRSRVEQALRDRISNEGDPGRVTQLKGILERLPAARISTVDSFCMNLVKRFPIYANVHPEFSVIEPADAQSLRFDSVKDALNENLGTLAKSDREDLIELITDSCGGLDRFLEHMEASLSSVYTTGKKQYSGSISDANLNLTRIRQRAVEIYEEKLARMKTLDFALIEDKAMKLLQGDAGDEARSGIDHVLVDEYQDINTVQDTLIRCLAAKPGASEGKVLDSKKLFIVGDPKQSIYRFRGAEPAIFEKWITEAKAKSLHVHLDRNYRSNPILIDFSNMLFGKMMQGKYSDSRPGRKPFELNGNVLVKLLACPKQEKNLLFDRTAMEVISLVGKTYANDDVEDARPLGLKDIALLTPSNNGMEPYIKAFKRHNIPVAVMKSGTFYESDSVAFLISLLGAAINDTDDISAYQLLASPAYGIREASIASICYYAMPISGCFAEVLPDIREHFFDQEEYDSFHRARQIVLAVRRMRSGYGTRELLEKLADYLGFEEDILRGYGRRGVANFRKLLELSSNAALSLGNLIDFQEHLTAYKSRAVQADEPDILDDDEEAVKIMTVHKAKGLEFPVVILGEGNYDLEEGPSQKETTMISMGDGGLVAKGSKGDSKAIYDLEHSRLQAENAAERQRLMYVAATRAEEIFIISGREESDKIENGLPLRKPRYLFKRIEEIDARLCGAEGFSNMRWDQDMQPVDSAVALPEECSAMPKRKPMNSQLMLSRSNDRIVRFSPSSIMSYINCPREFLRRQWYRLPEEEKEFGAGNTSAKPPYSASELGTIVHFIAQHSENPYEGKSAIEMAKVAFSASLPCNSELMSKVQDLVENYYDFIAKHKCRGRLMKEVDFSIAIGRFILEGMIDRLEEDGEGGWTVTDLKTNNLNKNDSESLAKKYEIQLMAYMYAAGRALSTEAVSSRLLFLVNNSTAQIDHINFKDTEVRLLEIMKSAATMPEECKNLSQACEKCKKKDECTISPYYFEDYDHDEKVISEDLHVEI